MVATKTNPKLEGGNMHTIRSGRNCAHGAHRMFVAGKWVETRSLRMLAEIGARTFWNKRHLAPPAAIDGYDFSNAKLRARKRAEKA